MTDLSPGTEPAATFEPPLADRVPIDDAAGPGARSEEARPSLVRRFGLPIALVAAGLVGGAALTGVAVADDGGSAPAVSDSGRGGAGPALTIPDGDSPDSTRTAPGIGGFTLPDHGRGPGSGHDGGTEADGGSALAAPGSHTTTGASA